MLDTVLFARDKWLKPAGCGKICLEYERVFNVEFRLNPDLRLVTNVVSPCKLQVTESLIYSPSTC